MSQTARSGRRCLAQWAGCLTAAALGVLVTSGTPADEPPRQALLAELAILDAPEPNRVVIDLAPDGHRPLRFILDTGAAHSYVTPQAARALGVPVRRAKSTPYRRPTRLGRDLQFWIDVSSSDTASHTNWEYAMLGGNFLAHYVLEVDFHGGRVRFFDPARYQVPASDDESGGVSLPIRVIAKRPVVEIEAGAARVPVLLDTGAPGTLILSREWARRAGAVAERGPAPEGMGVVGVLRLEPARLRRLRIGRFEEHEVPILVAPHGLHNQGAGTESVLGVEFLRRFVVRIDYPRQRLWLWEPGSGQKLGAESPAGAPSPTP